MWNKGEPLAVFLGDTAELALPFASYFGLRNGMLWEQYINTNGKEGVKPPSKIDDMQNLARDFTTVPAGTARSNELGRKIAHRTVEDLFFICTVKTRCTNLFFKQPFALQSSGNFILFLLSNVSLPSSPMEFELILS